MAESEFDRMLSARRDLKVGFIQSLFEGSATISAKDRIVVLPVTSFEVLGVLRLLSDLNVHTHIFGTEPISVAVSVEDAARVPLFDGGAKSRKYRRVASLASGKPDHPVDVAHRALSRSH